MLQAVKNATTHAWEWLRTAPLWKVAAIPLLFVLTTGKRYFDIPAAIGNLIAWPYFAFLMTALQVLVGLAVLSRWRALLSEHRADLAKERTEVLSAVSKIREDTFDRVNTMAGYIALMDNHAQLVEVLRRELDMHAEALKLVESWPGENYPDISRVNDRMLRALESSIDYLWGMDNFYAVAFKGERKWPERPIPAEVVGAKPKFLEKLPEKLHLQYQTYDVYRNRLRDALRLAREEFERQLAERRGRLFRSGYEEFRRMQ